MKRRLKQGPARSPATTKKIHTKTTRYPGINERKRSCIGGASSTHTKTNANQLSAEGNAEGKQKKITTMVICTKLEKPQSPSAAKNTRVVKKGAVKERSAKRTK